MFTLCSYFSVGDLFYFYFYFFYHFLPPNLFLSHGPMHKHILAHLSSPACLYHNAASWGSYLYSCHAIENLKRTVSTKGSTNQRTSQFLWGWRPILPFFVYLFFFPIILSMDSFVQVKIALHSQARVWINIWSHSWGLFLKHLFFSTFTLHNPEVYDEIASQTRINIYGRQKHWLL